MTYNELSSRVAKENFTLVDFYATWCGPCQAMHPILDELQRQNIGNVEIIRIDVDKSENVMLTQHYHIMSVPTLILFYEGRQLWRNSGVMSLELLTEVIKRMERMEVY